MSLIANTEVYRQSIRSSPVILDISAEDVGSLPPLTTRDTALILVGKTEIEISATVAAHSDRLSF